MRTPRRTTAAGAQTPPQSLVRGRRAHAGPPADESPEDPTGTTAEVLATRAERWRVRPRTVRAKIVCLLMMPVVSLLALWAHATVSTAQDVARLRQLQRVDSGIRTPVAAAVAALQAERGAAVRHASHPTAERSGDYERLAQATDKAVARLRLGDGNTVADGEELPAGVARRLEAFVTAAERLSTVRGAVLDRHSGWDETYGRYTRTIAAAFSVGGALSGIQDAELGSDARVLHEFARAGEALAQENTLLDSATLAGRLDGARLRLFTGAVDTRRAPSPSPPSPTCAAPSTWPGSASPPAAPTRNWPPSRTRSSPPHRAHGRSTPRGRPPGARHTHACRAECGRSNRTPGAV